MDAPEDAIYAARFACHCCGDAPVQYPTRCLQRGCFALVCGMCGMQSDNFRKCPVCGTRARSQGGVPQVQLARDVVLGDALRALYPEIMTDAPAREVDLQIRHADSVMQLVMASSKTAGVNRLSKNATYVDDLRSLVHAHAVQGTLSTFLTKHMCECVPPHICCPRRTTKGVVWSCPAYDHVASKNGASHSGPRDAGCRYFRRES